MENVYSRTKLLIGEKALEKLKKSAVLVFGAGGVGSYCIEALARAGIGTIGIVDGDKIEPTNINRQLYALNSTIGKYKTDVAKERIEDINHDICVKTYNIFVDRDTFPLIDLSEYSYVIDAIDNVTAKILLACACDSKKIPMISSMGAGNKITTDFTVTDIYSTKNCPLARVMRRELKKRGVKSLKVVYSENGMIEKAEHTDTIASISFVPPIAGLTCAAEVIKDLIR